MWLLPVAAHAESFSEAASRGVGPAFLFALVAGLLTSLTPCVYPMIPITLSVFGAKGVSRGRAFSLATVYVAGIAAMFGALGTVFGLLGKAFGTFMANPWVVVPICGLFVAMSASMFGAFELALPVGLQTRLSRVGGRGFAGAFLMGLVGGIIAAPCTGPALAGMLGWVARTRDAVTGFGLMSTYAIGIGVPFWLIAGFSMTLPRSGAWMENVKSVFGIGLLVVAAYFLKNVVPSLWKFTGHTPVFALGCAAALVVGLALGAIHRGFGYTWLSRLRKGVAVALVAVASFGLVNYALTPRTQLAWLHSEPEALAAALKADKPVLVDFGATWCTPCLEMEAHVFTAPAVASVLTDRFTLLKVDCDNEDDDPEVQRLRARYDAKTLPAIRILSPEGQVVGRLDEAVGADAFLDFLLKTPLTASR